jgi:Domain of unknown function (DUF4260)
MQYLLKAEELAMFLTTLVLFRRLDFSWWWYPLLIFTPDISMAGYLLGNKAGAILYNFIHHKALALGIWVYGMARGLETWQLAGLILFGHSSLDRFLGYGLKYYAGFPFTHLGQIGKTNNQSLSH